MKIFLILCLALASSLLKAQDTEASLEITNLMLVPNGFENQQILDEIIDSIEGHEGHLKTHRSDGVMSPMGAPEFQEVVEIHWESMEAMMEWAENMMEEVPQERRGNLTGVQIIFYEYR